MSTPKTLKLGAAIFPDLMLPELFARWGLFVEQGFKVEVLYYPWNELFQRLENREVDLIVGNQRLLRHKNETRQSRNRFLELFEFDIFFGWAIVARAECGLRTYEDLAKSDLASAPSKFLNQLRPFEIFASANTDYQLTFTALVDQFDRTVREFRINSKLEPNEAFVEFMTGDESRVFIGSGSHTKRALDEGCLSLLTNADELDTKQVNIFVKMSSTRWPSRDLLSRFESAITSGKKRFNNDLANSLDDLSALFSDSLKVYYPKRYRYLDLSRSAIAEVVEEMMNNFQTK